MAAKKKVLIYNGSFDVICNTPSTAISDVRREHLLDDASLGWDLRLEGVAKEGVDGAE